MRAFLKDKRNSKAQNSFGLAVQIVKFLQIKSPERIQETYLCTAT